MVLTKNNVHSLEDFSSEQIEGLAKIIMWKISPWNPSNIFNNDWQWDIEIYEENDHHSLIGSSKKHHISIWIDMDAVLESDKKFGVTNYTSKLFPSLGRTLVCDFKTFQSNFSKFKKIYHRLNKIYHQTMNEKLEEIRVKKIKEVKQKTKKMDTFINDLK